MFKRFLFLPTSPQNSFFLWGPRQSGKTSLLRTTYPMVQIIDLLKSDERLKYLEDPSLLRKELQVPGAPNFIIIDEIQKVPQLLDEVHWLIENRNVRFCLCGSSARKLRREGANLLGGRALRFELFGLTSVELKDQFSLDRILNHGYLPRHYIADDPTPLIRSYVTDYLTEEISQEALVRSLPKFSSFLRAAALSDTEIVQYVSIAADCAVSGPTVKDYFQILVDTLLGSYLPSYVRRQKRKVLHAPKFYMSDVGIVNNLAKRGRINLGSELAGKAFENWIHHELISYRVYSEKYFDISYWRLAGSQYEVDFIINDMEIAIEVKTANRIGGHHLKSLYEIQRDNPSLKRIFLVCLETKRRIEGGKIEVIPYTEFIEELWSGTLI